jgi:valyl-tRNA synthetase
MICTYGDKEDVKIVIKHKLPIITMLTENGTINENGAKYVGLTISEAKEAIVKDLEAAGLLQKTEKIQQEIGVCDRCETPVEILERKQWFMKTRILTDKVEKTADEIAWYFVCSACWLARPRRLEETVSSGFAPFRHRHH